MRNVYNQTRPLLASMLLLCGTCLLTHQAAGQSFVPSVSISGGGGTPPPHAYDIVNNDPSGNVGIGLFPGHPFPAEKLIVGGNISLDPFNQNIERKILGHSPIGLLGIYSANYECDGAALRLYGENEANNPGLVDLTSMGISGQAPAFQLRTFEPCRPYMRMVITRNGLTGIGFDIDASLLNAADRLSVDHSLALISLNDAEQRHIRARTAAQQLNIMAGDGVTDGSGIQLFGSSNPGAGLSGPNTPSGITFNALYNNSGNEVAYKFCHYQPATNTMRTSFTISNQLTARFGPGYPTSERLMVDGNLFLYDANDAPRGVVGHSGTGEIDLSSGSGAADGSNIRLLALNNTTGAGQIHFNAIGVNGKAFSFITKNTTAGGSAALRAAIDMDGKTHLSNDLDFNLSNGSVGANIRGIYSKLNLYSHNDYSDGSTIAMTNTSLRFTTGTGGAAAASAYAFDLYGATLSTPLMAIHNDGKVVIGNNNTLTTPGIYKLYVEDGIMTEKVRVAVKTTTSWADFVFADDYRLKPLSEVAGYIRLHRHLPDVPSAQEVVDKGIDMAQMDAKLLQKVEELTLYVIKLQAEVTALKDGAKH